MENEINGYYISSFKKSIHEYLQTNKKEILQEALRFYTEEIEPKIKELRQLKYDICQVEINKNSSTFHLYQIKNNLDKNEFVFFNKNMDKVNKYII
jgi:hypothetical protein